MSNYEGWLEGAPAGIVIVCGTFRRSVYGVHVQLQTTVDNVIGKPQCGYY